ncbi:hypothetical protein M501DRAFT_1031819 [Patellaria atrata CBS 101060]|uniref:Tetratricopeptide repeat protein n=1 Tax=Patellaria atrata CBS 101060 TaxID=1346257 RepID=A0A9P4SBF5_9PEZI|nr:hypothetical protein M501DRAFT_1031819 [Patellaria atrata CBS 101060]
MNQPSSTDKDNSGALWRAMGKIRSTQQKYDDALECCERAVENLKIIIGDKHYMTGDCFHDLSLAFSRKNNPSKALKNLSKAIQAFGDAPYRQEQAARVLWKKGRC